MSITLAIKNILPKPISTEWLMTEYAKHGDHRVLSELYDQCSKDLYHFTLTMSDPERAKDICQKVWLKVIEKRHSYQPNGSFLAWLFAMARHQLIDEYRSNKPTQSLGDRPLLQVFGEHKLEEAFAIALAKLPWQQREAFCLQQQGFSLNDISAITGEDFETIKSRLRYAKTTLKRRLEKYYE